MYFYLRYDVLFAYDVALDYMTYFMISCHYFHICWGYDDALLDVMTEFWHYDILDIFLLTSWHTWHIYFDIMTYLTYFCWHHDIFSFYLQWHTLAYVMIFWYYDVLFNIFMYFLTLLYNGVFHGVCFGLYDGLCDVSMLLWRTFFKSWTYFNTF